LPAAIRDSTASMRLVALILVTLQQCASSANPPPAPPCTHAEIMARTPGEYKIRCHGVALIDTTYEFEDAYLSYGDFSNMYIKQDAISFADATLTGANFAGSQFISASSTFNFGGVEAENSDLSGSTIIGTNVRFAGADFYNANLSGAYILSSSYMGGDHVRFSHADLSGASLVGQGQYGNIQMANGTTFKEADLSSAFFSAYDDVSFHSSPSFADRVGFQGADLSHATFSSDTGDVVFWGANVTSADFSSAYLFSASDDIDFDSYTDMTNANFHDVYMNAEDKLFLDPDRGYKGDAVGADFSSATLRVGTIDARYGNFKRADFSGASIFSHQDFEGKSFGVAFSYGILDSADFSGATLMAPGVDIEFGYSSMENAKFTDAYLLADEFYFNYVYAPNALFDGATIMPTQGSSDFDIKYFGRGFGDMHGPHDIEADGAVFQGAELHLGEDWADFTGSTLTNADFSGATIHAERPPTCEKWCNVHTCPGVHSNTFISNRCDACDFCQSPP